VIDAGLEQGGQLTSGGIIIMNGIKYNNSMPYDVGVLADPGEGEWFSAT